MVKKGFKIIFFFLIFFSYNLYSQEYKGILCIKNLKYFQITKDDYISEGSLNETKTLNIVSAKLPDIKNIIINDKNDNLNPKRFKKLKYLIDPIKEKVLTFSLLTDDIIVKDDFKKVSNKIKETRIINSKYYKMDDYEINEKTIKNGIYLVYLVDAKFFNQNYEQMNVDSNKKIYLYRLLTEEDIE